MIRTCDIPARVRHGRASRRAGRRSLHIAAGTWRRLIREICLIAAFAVIYEVIRDNMAQVGSAAASHALLIVSAEQALGLFREHAVQSAIIGNDTVTDAFNAYYGGTHFLIPVLVLVFYLPYTWTNFASAAIFGLAAITDWLDGWIARRYQLESAFGAFLDPVADKLMVAVALFLIVQGHPTPWMAFWAAVIVGREIAVSALREWMAELGQRAKVRVAMIGKVKTTAQMVALLCLLYSVAPNVPVEDIWMGWPVFHIGDWTLAIAAVLTLWSGLQYLHAAWPSLRDDERAARERARQKKLGN